MLMFRDQEKGFTLLEVLVAITVLTVGLLGMALMQASAIRANAFAANTTEAVNWAEDQMEKLMMLPWDDPLLQDTDGDGVAGLTDTGYDSDPATLADSDHPAVIHGGYRIYWNVAADVTAPDTKTVTVNVLWSDHGTTKSVSLRNLMSKLG